MKTKLVLIAILFATLSLSSCLEQGESSVRLDGSTDINLPPELKGLKVYSVGISGGDVVKVAVINGDVNSLTYTVGKTQQTTIVVNKDRYNERVIEADEIISETDDIIVIRKKK
jgi:hypothetical protein